MKKKIQRSKQPRFTESAERGGHPLITFEKNSLPDQPRTITAKSRSSGTTLLADFGEVIQIIEVARNGVFQQANIGMLDLYWDVGQYISRKLETAVWGDGVVLQLARHLSRTRPDIKGFDRANLFRMRQFHETYRHDTKVVPLARQLSWTHNLRIMGRCKTPEEREFYLRLAVSERWSKRDLERQLKVALFERAVLNPPQIAAALRAAHPTAGEVFRDSYLLEFLDLPEVHSESELQRGLVSNLRKFLIELGSDFCFISEQKHLSVGGQDYFLDLLFFHRGLNCLVVIELKIEEFEPGHLGKLEFYLEAVDRTLRKPHENASIGLLLCASKNAEIVEYALSRSLSPALIAEYQTQLPDRTILQRKLHEFYLQLSPSEDSAPAKPAPKQRSQH